MVLTRLSCFSLTAEVPQNIRLTLDVELVDMEKEDLFKAIDKNSDKYISLQEVEEWMKVDEEVCRTLFYLKIVS